MFSTLRAFPADAIQMEQHVTQHIVAVKATKRADQITKLFFRKF